MQFYKKILILFILFIFTIILFKLLMRRDAILSKMKKKEGFSDNVISKTNTNANISPIKTIKENETYLPLKQYVYKSSYNTAIKDNKVDTEMIKYILSRGTRFLDFEVFYINDIPVVSYTTDTTFQVLQTSNTISLSDILTEVMANAFSQDTPNPKDPLFIQLRIKSLNPDVYKEVAKIIDFAFKNKLYPYPIDNNTLLNDVMNKVVLVVYRTLNYNYKNDCYCKTPKNCYDLTKYINIESGSEFLNLERYNTLLQKKRNPPMILDDNETTNVSKFQIVLPEFNNKNIRNPKYQDFVTNYGCQIVPFCYYKNDLNLEEYEKLFEENLLAFIPLSHVITYYKKLDEYNKS